MSRQIVKQPDGKYAVFSTVVDGFIAINMSPAQIIEEFVEEAKEDITERVNNICNKLESGGKPYHQFTMTWDEAKELHEQHHGKLEV